MSDIKAPFTFKLPSTFNPYEFLRTPNLRLLADDARYFISLILTKFSRNDVDDQGNVRLMAKHLRSVMHKHHYSSVVDALLERGAVVRSPYSVGEKSFGYMLADRFIDDGHVRVPIECPRLIGRLVEYHKRNGEDRLLRMLPVHLSLEAKQHDLRIDGEAAREILGGLSAKCNPFDSQGILVSDIERREFHVNVGHYGRLSNNITSLKRELRTTLTDTDGKQLKHVDIACCQPALLAKLAMLKTQLNQCSEETTGWKREGRERQDSGVSIYDAPHFSPIKYELTRFYELVQSGDFYDFMVREVRSSTNADFTRDEMKKRFLVDVIAKQKANKRGAEYPSAIEDCFRNLFPTVYGFIRETNHDGWEHANLIRRLQQEESSLVIETVAAMLLESDPDIFIVTLHDAIFTTPEYIQTVTMAFDKAFQDSGFTMTVKVAC